LRNRVRAEPRVTLQTTASRAMLRIEREAVEVEAGQRPAERSSAIRSEPVGSKLREETAPPAPHKKRQVPSSSTSLRRAAPPARGYARAAEPPVAQPHSVVVFEVSAFTHMTRAPVTDMTHSASSGPL